MWTSVAFGVLLVATVSALDLVVPQKSVVCPSIGTTSQSTRLESSDPVKNFNEISGLALSPNQIAPSGDPVLFGVSDGGGGERLGMFDSGTGQRLLTLKIPSWIITNQDWEDMAIGSCGSTGVNDTCLYIADVGDNTARNNRGTRTNRGTIGYRILKIREPLLQDFDASNNEIPGSYLSLMAFDYFDETSPTKYADCEASFIDNVGWGEGGEIGDLYLVTKWNEAEKKDYNRLFKIPALVWPSYMDASQTFYSPKAVGSYESWGGLMQHTWTGADATFDGTLIALGTIEGNYLFLRCPGATVAEALAAPNGATQHCLRWDPPSPGQVETISWTVDGMRSINIPEGGDKPLGWTSMVYDPTITSQTCPQVEWIYATVAEGQRTRYGCRSEVDGSTKPDAWCEASIVDSPQAGKTLLSEETVGETQLNLVEVTLADVAEETPKEIAAETNGGARRRTRHLRSSV